MSCELLAIAAANIKAVHRAVQTYELERMAGTPTELAETRAVAAAVGSFMREVQELLADKGDE